MTLTTQQTSVEVDHFNQPAEMERKFDREREKKQESEQYNWVIWKGIISFSLQK